MTTEQTQHARDSAELRRLCSERDKLREKVAELEGGTAALRLVRDEYKRHADEYRAKWSALPVRAMADGWTLAADQKPQTGKAVIAHYTNSHGMGRRIRAEYIAAWMVQAEDVSDPDTECVEYSEQDDAYYLTAGWYELVDNWDEYGRIAVTEGVITHWMPLPAAPTPAPTVEPAHSDVSVPRELTNQCAETCERAKLCAVCAGGIYKPTLPVWMDDPDAFVVRLKAAGWVSTHDAQWTGAETLRVELRALLNGGRDE